MSISIIFFPDSGYSRFMSFYRTKTGKYKFRNFLLISMANKKPGINIFMLIPGKVAVICASSACGY